MHRAPANSLHLPCVVLGLALGIHVSAQTLRIDSLQRDGTLTWTIDLPNRVGVLAYRTNLTTGPWVIEKQVVTAGGPTTSQVTVPTRGNRFYRVSLLPLPQGMVLIPPGPYEMGDAFAEGFPNALPVHTVKTSGFYMDRLEISNDEMRRVLQWAYGRGLIGATAAAVTNREGQAQLLVDLKGDDHGYPNTHLSFANGVFAVAAGRENFPCTGVFWYGAQAYCNYRSDMESLARCINFADWSCDFTKNGYRLPTEAEWEKAARGGLAGNHYPWPSAPHWPDPPGTYRDYTDGSKANWNGSGDPYEPWTTPVGYYNGNQVPPGVDMANGYGLYDMAGNVWEWCWDVYQADWYSQPGASLDDTHGPALPVTRPHVIRSGAAGYYDPVYLTCACRHSQGWGPLYASPVVGFRPVRRL